MKTRPKCKRCGGPLDLWTEPKDNKVYFYCNNPHPIQTDEQFWKRWGNLSGDDIARLQMGEINETV